MNSILWLSRVNLNGLQMRRQYPGHSMIVFWIARISFHLSSSGGTKEFWAYFALQCWPG